MGSRRLQHGVRLGVLAGALVAAGCGGEGNKTPTGPPTPLPSYLARYSAGSAGAVYFIQWQRRHESVDGTLTIAVPGTTETSARTQPLTGELDGRRVTLEVGTDSPQRWDGKRTGRTIVFRVELGDGSTQRLRFVPAKLADYKRTVAEIRNGG